MILCLRCKKVWANGSRTCGSCRSTLGKRFCDEGHESPLSADCCIVCGTAKLTPGVPCLNLRPFTYLVILAIGYVLLPILFRLTVHYAAVIWEMCLHAVLIPILETAIFSWIAARVLGPRAAQLVSDFWHGVFRLSLQGIEVLGRGLKSLWRSL